MGNRIKAAKSLKDQPLEKGGGVYWRNENLLMVRYKDKKKIFYQLFMIYKQSECQNRDKMK